MIDLIFASLIQGITEFIPVSSSLHLLIYENFFSNKELSLVIISSMHMGSILALILFTFFDTKSHLSIFKTKSFNMSLIISTLPIFIVGMFFYNTIAEINNISILIISTTIFFGIILFLSDNYSESKKKLNDISYIDSLSIGLIQCLSLVPGVSRSASVIIGSRMMKIDRESSILYSLFLSAPVITGAFLYSLYRLNNSNIGLDSVWLDVALSLFFSFVSSYFTLKFFYKFSKNRGFGLFAFYRIFLGVILIIVF